MENKGSKESNSTVEKKTKKAIWLEIQEEVSKFPKNIFVALVTTLLLSLIAGLADVANVACWPKYLLLHEAINIQKEPYHIGDTEASVFFHQPPQLNPFVSTFKLCRITDKMYLTLSAKHVDPDITTSPISIFINGVFIDYLNNYVQKEMDEAVVIQIPIPEPENSLIVGNNYIMILSGADSRGIEYGQYNTDDIEFWDLNIQR